MTTPNQTLTLLVYGPSKVGKSYLADSAPAPRLVLDAEMGNRFTPSKKFYWDPMYAPPTADGTWDTCVVEVRDYNTFERAHQWLQAGQHPFRAVAIDSLSELQQRCIDSIAGVNQMSTSNWGDLLRKIARMVRDFRDYTSHPTNPVQTVTVIGMDRVEDGRHTPFMQGSIKTMLPFYFDVTGYLFTQQMDDGRLVRRLLMAPHPQYDAGDRTGRLPQIMDDPSIPLMLDTIYTTEATL